MKTTKLILFTLIIQFFISTFVNAVNVKQVCKETLNENSNLIFNATEYDWMLKQCMDKYSSRFDTSSYSSSSSGGSSSGSSGPGILGMIFIIIFAIIIIAVLFSIIGAFIDAFKPSKTLEEYEENWAGSDKNWPKISPIQYIFAGKKKYLIEYAKKNNVIVTSRDTIDEILDKLAPLKQNKLLTNLSKSDLIKYAKCGYYDSNKDAMVSGVMRADYDMSEEELREDRVLIKTLTKAQIIEKIIQNKGRKVEKITHQQTDPQITAEEFENKLLESNVVMLSEYTKLKQSEIVEKLELCDSEILNALGLSYKKTDKKEVLLKKILTYGLNTNTKVRLIHLADKQGVSIQNRDTKAQIIEKIINIK
jgi:hypothetical protein